MRIRAFTYALSLAAAVAAAGEVRFTAKPRARRLRGKTKIEFAVSSPTGVEVAVLDSKGKVVRHLAAGMLGANPPKPLKRGLRQEIEWDGNDDDGKPARGGPFKVRVGLDLEARLHEIIGWSGQKVDGTKGLASGPDGTLYVVYGRSLYAHRQTWLVSAFDGDGKYLRQVFPGPANLPPEKRKGWPRVKLDDGREIPFVFHLLPRTTYPGAVLANRMFPVVTRDGRMVMLSGPGHTTIKHPDFRGGRRLLILGTDGGVPEDFLGPEVCPMVGGFGHIALSPDEKYVYASGFVSTGRKGRGPCNVVCRVGLDGSEKGKVFIGKMYEAGSGRSGLKDPQGLATDKEGNIYVSDYGNNRVAVFKRDGSYLDEIKVEHPDGVKVSRRTGAIYVVCLEERKKPFTDGHWYTAAHNWKVKRIVKFGGLKDKTEKASWPNPLKSKYGGGAYLALDESGGSTVLWVTGLRYGCGPIYKVVEKGGRLESAGTPIDELAKKEKGESLGFIGDVAVTGEKVISRHPAFGMHTNTSYVYSAETGEYVGKYVPKREDGKKPENMWTLLYGEMVAGRDGNLYVRSRGDQVRRYDATGKQLPFASVGKNFLRFYYHSHTRGPGIFADRKGTMYVPCEAVDREKLAAMKPEELKKLGLGRKLRDMTVSVVGADGKVIREAVSIFNARIGGVVADREGNIYVGAQAAPKASLIPEWFAGKLPADGPAHHPSLEYKQYATVFKFPPTGGAIAEDRQGTWTSISQYKRENVTIKKALWTKRLGYIGSHGRELGCHCETTRFDIDGYGRLFVPDIYRFCVYVLDGNGNEIGHFGSYGNMDSRGPGSPVPEPEIAFGWPLSVECAGGRVFVADLVNRRVVAVNLKHAVEEIVAVR